MTDKDSKAADSLLLELQKIRVEKGITQNALALKLGVSRNTIVSWETGTIYPNISRIVTWARTLGYEFDLHRRD